MPNYATNRLILSGPADEIKRFQATCVRQQNDVASGEMSFDFDAITPMPAEIVATLDDNTDVASACAFEATGFRDWLSWSLARWGTKWNASSFAVLTAGPNLLDLTFDTAWSSPEPIFRAIAAQYPLLKGYALAADPMMDWALFGVIGHGDYGSTALEAAELSFLIDDCTLNAELSRISAYALVEEWTNITSSDRSGEPVRSAAIAATTAVKAALSAEVVVKLEFVATHRTHSESFADCGAEALDDGGPASLAFFTAENRCRTELDLELLEKLADTVRMEAISPSSHNSSLSDFSSMASKLAERCGEEELHAWAALAMYRPGVSLDLSDTASLRLGFAMYAGRLYAQAAAHLKHRASGLKLQAPAAAVSEA